MAYTREGQEQSYREKESVAVGITYSLAELLVVLRGHLEHHFAIVRDLLGRLAVICRCELSTECTIRRAGGGSKVILLSGLRVFRCNSHDIVLTRGFAVSGKGGFDSVCCGILHTHCLGVCRCVRVLRFGCLTEVRKSCCSIVILT